MDSALEKDWNYYLQILLKECKYIKSVIRHNIEDLEISSEDSDEEYMPFNKYLN